MALLQNNNKTIWLSPEVLQWLTYSQGGAEPDVTVRLRAYEVWNHAEKTLGHAASELQLVDVITTLNRSVVQRIRALDNLYSFRTIPIKPKPSDILSLLGFFDIVRPLMFRNLFEIRNAVEHADAKPPDRESSQIFLEFAWYFLKSTDRMLQLVSDQIGFYPVGEEDDYFLELEYGPKKDWKPSLRGWVPANLISTQPADNWIALTSAEIESRGDLLERLREKGEAQLLDHHNRRERLPDDVYVKGEIRGPRDVMISLTSIYFSAV